MRIMRVTAQGFGCFAVLALGCVGGKGAAPVGVADEAVNCEGCPNDSPVGTYNYDPPHAFPGTCEQANPEVDGAFEEMMDHCRQYCGQSHASCGAAAQLEGVHCVDRDIGHRWEATCVCGALGGAGAGFGPGFGPGVGGGAVPTGPYPYPGSGFGPQQGPGWQASGGWQQPPWLPGGGWNPPSGWWDAPHGIQGAPPSLPETGFPGWGSPRF
jgi:hypothetical protein